MKRRNRSVDPLVEMTVNDLDILFLLDREEWKRVMDRQARIDECIAMALLLAF